MQQADFIQNRRKIEKFPYDFLFFFGFLSCFLCACIGSVVGSNGLYISDSLLCSGLKRSLLDCELETSLFPICGRAFSLGFLVCIANPENPMPLGF